MKPWKIVSMISVVIVVLLGIIWLASFSFTGNVANIDGSGLPSFATKNPDTLQAYKYAMEMGDDFEYIACYCGCGMHAMEHRGKIIPKMNNLKDCFVRGDGSFEDHAALDCPACVTFALEAGQMIEEGKSLREVRATIDKRYGVQGVGTNTPYPV